MLEKINKLIEIGKYLNDDDYSVQLVRMHDSLENKEYLLSVMGQFSAGKSRLINNLLEKDVLPVHTTETTALITFIRYGKDEHAELIHMNGTSENVDISDVSKLWQSGDTEKLSKLESIIVYVDSPILASGLVLADTPGINTIIEKHQELTGYILRRSDRILYVMNKSMTASDQRFLNKIREDGLSIIFARTRMDTIEETGEDPVEAAGKDLASMMEYTDDTVFFLSNERSSMYYNCVSELREYLSDTIGSDISAFLEEDCRKRAAIIAEHYIGKLDGRLSILNDIADGRTQELENKRQDLQNAMETLNRRLEKNRKKLNDRFRQIESDAASELSDGISGAKKRVRLAIDQIPADSTNMSEMIANLVSNEYDRLAENYISMFETLIKDSGIELKSFIAEDLLSINIDDRIPDSFSEVDEVADSLKARIAVLQHSAEEAENTISELKSNMTNNACDNPDYELQLSQTEEELRNSKKQLDELGEYVPQYICTDPGSNSAEKSMRFIGNIADWATILIPGSGWAKGAEKAATSIAKVMKNVPKLAGAAEKVVKVGAQIGKSKKLIQGIDAVADVTRIAKKVGGKDMREADQIRKSRKADIGDVVDGCMREKEEKKPGLLDFLSLEYHMGNIGKMFDKPPVYAVNREYEQQYYEQREQIRKTMMDAAQRQYKLKIEKDERRSQLDKQKEKLRIQEAFREKANEEIKKLTEQFNIEQKKKAVAHELNFYHSQADKAIEQVGAHIHNDISKAVSEKIQDYIAVCDFGLKSQINEKLAELDAVKEQYENQDRENLNAEIEICNGFLQEAKEMAHE